MIIDGIEYVRKDRGEKEKEKLEVALKDANRKIEQLTEFVSVLVPNDYRIHKALDDWMERLTKKYGDGDYCAYVMGRDNALRFLNDLGALDGNEKANMLRENTDLKNKLNGAKSRIGRLEAQIDKGKASTFTKSDLEAFKKAEKTLCRIIKAMEEG